MAASTGDKITDVRNAARPNSARATGTRSAGGTSLACDNLAGWPTASKVHFVTYQLNSSSAQVAGTQLDCTGIVSGNTIGSITVIDGTDTGNSVNDVVEMIPTAAWGQDLADALTNQHSRTGTHTVITATSLTTTGNSSIGGNETVTGTLGVTGVLTPSGGLSSGSVSGAALATSAITLGYTQITSSFSTTSTTVVQVTGLTATVTVPAGGRSIKITAFCPYIILGTAPKLAQMSIWDGTVGSGTQLQNIVVENNVSNNQGATGICIAVVTPAAGSKTYNVGGISDPSGGITATFSAATTTPAFLLVEAI